MMRNSPSIHHLLYGPPSPSYLAQKGIYQSRKWHGGQQSLWVWYSSHPRHHDSTQETVRRAASLSGPQKRCFKKSLGVGTESGTNTVRNGSLIVGNARMGTRRSGQVGNGGILFGGITSWMYLRKWPKFPQRFGEQLPTTFKQAWLHSDHQGILWTFKFWTDKGLKLTSDSRGAM